MIDLMSEGIHLAALEFGDPDRAPAERPWRGPAPARDRKLLSSRSILRSIAHVRSRSRLGRGTSEAQPLRADGGAADRSGKPIRAAEGLERSDAGVDPLSLLTRMTQVFS